MPDFVSRKRLKKKVIDRWENEGGTTLADRAKAASSHPPPKRKRKNMRGQLPEKRVNDRT